MVNQEDRKSMRGMTGVKRSAAYVCLSVAIVAGGAACSVPEHSRSLGDARVSGNTLALQVCANCHGVQGVSVSPNFPNLAAQTAPYLVAQLQSFKGHGRSDPEGFEYMWGISARLTDEQIAALAAYFSAQKPPSPPKKPGDPALLKNGQSIFEQGIASSNTPACASCHGAHAEGMQQFPRLAGQHADYIIKQLMVFQNTDQRPAGVVMKTVSHAMTPQDMKNVAAYLEAMPAQ
ncbi:MAG TPA: c-type cytochrome [Herbaspirillum sp.]|nr:c-type cytochrome [Herbaspirillum sp.]